MKLREGLREFEGTSLWSFGELEKEKEIPSAERERERERERDEGNSFPLLHKILHT